MMNRRDGGKESPVEARNLQAPPRETKRERFQPAEPAGSRRAPESEVNAFEDLQRVGRIAAAEDTDKKPRPSHWRSSLPDKVAPIPPGAVITPPEVTVTVEGRRHSPRFQGAFSDRMLISPKGDALLSVSWPAEHKTDTILVSTINDGRINGEPGAVLKKGKDGRFRFRYQAGPHSGAAQVVLTAATLSYSLNFWVPTGNPNVDPPALR